MPQRASAIVLIALYWRSKFMPSERLRRSEVDSAQVTDLGLILRSGSGRLLLGIFWRIRNSHLEWYDWLKWDQMKHYNWLIISIFELTLMIGSAKDDVRIQSPIKHYKWHCLPSTYHKKFLPYRVANACSIPLLFIRSGPAAQTHIIRTLWYPWNISRLPERPYYREPLKNASQVVWIWGEKIAFSCLQ